MFLLFLSPSNSGKIEWITECSMILHTHQALEMICTHPTRCVGDKRYPELLTAELNESVVCDLHFGRQTGLAGKFPLYFIDCDL